MPFVKIYYGVSVNSDFVNNVNETIHTALVECFEVPASDTFQIWIKHKNLYSYIDSQYSLPEHKKRSDNFLYIDILCAFGRTIEQKKQLYQMIATVLSEKGYIKIEDIFITLTEIPRENWSFGEGLMQAVIEGEK